jgi:carboxymethylenebutenolidase
MCSYCYGAKMVVETNKAGLTQASGLVHPSMLKESDIDALKTPTTFALAELDDAFPDSLHKFSEKKLAEKKVVSEFVVYEDTTHGFASRGDLELEATRKGQEGATQQIAQWFSKHLLD